MAHREISWNATFLGFKASAAAFTFAEAAAVFASLFLGAATAFALGVALDFGC